MDNWTTLCLLDKTWEREPQAILASD